MATTDVDLYRAVQKNTYDGWFESDGMPKDGFLYPSFNRTKFFNRKEQRWIDRRPDVAVKDGNVDKDGGGLSMHDTAGVLGFASWKYFGAPKGTEYQDLFINGPGEKKAIRAGGIEGCHYQIEPARMMTVETYKGALDNFARAAIVRQVKLAKGEIKEEKKE
ncbi:Tse2 family ADP-ribosyltransferase toxin [Paraburkholderia kirstenboschensis]|uniref:Tse2 ADP-ribosyltransferase toxin domain-containing protein n=1 Tax=Paraburkholderia kirstenboschensis TaxID=1245436 RepID=A0ABZ0EAI2_9BURK|nr:hypothetical protein [Paraburkholderia kirstenboschensis]WOD14245.1 hypothetical protein RW095_01680 [Paraburkholderia kirstenboschensis]